MIMPQLSSPMIAPPPDWHHRRSGDVYMYMPRDPTPGCVLTYSERVSPLRSLAAHVRETLETDAEFEPTAVFTTARFLTLEGEYGARAVIKGHRGQQPVAHVIAAVFADDFSTRVTARITDLARLDEYIAMVVRLARHDRLGLGIRRRRYMFQPPSGWHAVPGIGLELAFYPPEYPKRRACLVVSPAEPIALSGGHPRSTLADQDVRQGLSPVLAETSMPLATRSALLKGELWRSSRALPGAGKMVRSLAVLMDGRYYYALRLEALAETGDADDQILIQTAGSVEPLPVATPVTQDSLALWQD